MRKSGLLLLLFEVLFAMFFIWLNKIPISLASAESCFFIIILFAVFYFTIIYTFIPKNVNWGLYGVQKYSKITISLFAVIFAAYFLFIFSGSVLFRSSAYYNLLGSEEERQFSADIAPFDYTQIPYVDTELADRLADKLMGSDAGMGSQFEVGQFTRQSVNGKLVMVAPINHKTFFSWLSNLEGTPGYITISATNPQDIKLVKEVNGKSAKIKYGTSGLFNQDIIRYIRINGYLTQLLTDPSFEIDDEGIPYWVVTTYTNKISWNGSDATGVIAVNAVNGDIKKYNIADLPSWIDRVQPKEFFQKQLSDRGQYVHGIFNFSDKDKLKPTGQIQLVYNNGKCYFYEGLTSIGKDNSTVGFVLCDTRTKKITKYKMSGCLENAAQRSAEGKVQNYGYKASNPLLINVEGMPTFFMTLKDNEGLIKQYGMVNIQNYQAVGVGDAITDCRDNYLKVVMSGGGTITSDVGLVKKEITGSVLRISWNISNGNTTYYIILADNPNVIYKVLGNLSDKLPLTNVNDTVKIVYNEQNNKNTGVIEFDNLSIK